MELQLQELAQQVQEAIETIEDKPQLIEYKNTILGKKGKLTEILKWVKDLTPEQKATVGKMSNDLKKNFAHIFSDRMKYIDQEKMKQQLKEEFEDMNSSTSLGSNVRPWLHKAGGAHGDLKNASACREVRMKS